ncbi:4-alpha-glucanotransferase [Sulfidibacter corallicola]|uniref:4-alpha-glucanotransferase n=1 Tax=Sulfidibacter corallicola TaxID=2818388 RepID=A0A8A4TZP7_SULCO|nr:4-alpha-glucanotransferase [Sulfidibacter corallicola]QTD51975.1 4-alpha-glucanotransferase [Sulfidibacter corallicola]
MKFERQSGIVLHPTSLPGPYGIGEIGTEAFAFVDALAEMGQRLWQVLPLGPTSYGDSPYQCLSSFAGNHLLISFEALIDQGLLQREELAGYPSFSPGSVDFGAVIPAREGVLAVVANRFQERAGDRMKDEFAAFRETNADWLADYALFVALKRAHGGRPWMEWAPELVRRDPQALDQARREHAAIVAEVEVQQFLFSQQWQALEAYCHDKGIQLIGDIPIFVAHDSADVWAEPEWFHLTEEGHCTVVAGVPPDYFSATGQRWGNPLYRWDRMAENDFAWWKRRLRTLFELVDIVRIDHFRGFEAYWEIPASEETAVNGKWISGPGCALFEAFEKEFDRLPIIAEDLGIITEAVDQLRDKCGFPGMRVLQFIVGNDQNEPGYWPDQFPEESVCYTGTHDNDTTLGWYLSGKSDGQPKSPEEVAEEQHKIRTFLECDGSQVHWDMLALSLGTKSSVVIAPLQDLLGLTSEARLNQPGRAEGNWRWRFEWDQLTVDVKQRMKALTAEHGR